MSFTAGQIVEGKVTGITNFGAFIELAPGQQDWFISLKSLMCM